MNSHWAVVAAASEATADTGASDVWGYIDRFGFPIVCAVVTASFLAWLVRFLIKYFVKQIEGWEDRWKEERNLRVEERDLRIEAERARDVAIEEVRMSKALYEALKQHSKGEVSP